MQVHESNYVGLFYNWNLASRKNSVKYFLDHLVCVFGLKHI